VIRIVEVGPRDGLQNEATPLATEAKAEFIRSLAAAGLREIEATSFVSPKWVPQLGDAAELWASLKGLEEEGVRLSALVPNLKGLERAMETGVRRMAVFTAASDAFTQKNINMTIEESLGVFAELVHRFRTRWEGEESWVRGYVSTAFECPYSGPVAPERVIEVCRRLLAMGVDEISVGDTIGVAVPREVRELTRLLARETSLDRLAYHFHDTRGTAIANVAEALERGVQAFDAAAGGLGGCPYCPGAGGNLATEDLVYFLERSGIPTGIDLRALAEASLPVLRLLARAPAAKAQRAALGETCPK
jgi:hydroxymethylglutaryl-CoA lyase